LKKTVWETRNKGGRKRIIVTKQLPGERWLALLSAADCRVEICVSEDKLSPDEIIDAIGERCDGAIGQLTEDWNESVFEALKNAGAVVYSNYAVGYNNVDVTAATRYRIAVGNTPGVLTETTAELAVALTLAAARRIVEADDFMRSGKYSGWLPTLYLGKLLYGKTVGVIGAGRIGETYASMMVKGFSMNLIYHDIRRNYDLENDLKQFGDFLYSSGRKRVQSTYSSSIDAVLREADVISLHPVLDATTHHLINAERLRMMKEDAVLVNASRGPVIDEKSLVAHLKKHPDFRAGLDVYENEPSTAHGLRDCPNAVIVPHIGSATGWTRRGMALLAAANVAAIINRSPVWGATHNIDPFFGDNPPKAAPSIVNAQDLGIPPYS
jgi:hydroxypyruvate reductase 1